MHTTVSLPLSSPAPALKSYPRCQWHHAPRGNTLLRSQTTPAERISHARTAHDRVTADSLSLVVHVLDWVQGQRLLTPPPMSSKLVSKFAIPVQNSKYPGHRHIYQSNRLVLCEIRFIANSPNQDSGVSIYSKRNFYPRHKSAMRCV